MRGTGQRAEHQNNTLISTRDNSTPMASLEDAISEVESYGPGKKSPLDSNCEKVWRCAINTHAKVSGHLKAPQAEGLRSTGSPHGST